MQVYGRGLRRRLPSMLGGDQARLRMVYSLTMSLPGTPTIFYGEEIGLGGEPRPARPDGGPHSDAVATRLRSVASRPSGRSRELVRPFPGPPFSPDEVNVAGQRHDPASLLSFFRQRIQAYRECPELGWGSMQVVEQDVAAAFVHRCDWQGGTVLLCHNLGPDACSVTIALPEEAPGTRCVDLLDPTTELTFGDGGALALDLEPYAARWYRLVRGETAALL